MKNKKDKFNDEEVKARFLDGVRKGLPITQCCGLAGISDKTFYNWQAKAEEDPDGPHAEFIREIEKAEAELTLEYLSTVEKTAKNPTTPSWRAAMAFLEKRFPQTFGKRMSVQIDGELVITAKDRQAIHKSRELDAMSTQELLQESEKSLIQTLMVDPMPLFNALIGLVETGDNMVIQKVRGILQHTLEQIPHDDRFEVKMIEQAGGVFEPEITAKKKGAIQ